LAEELAATGQRLVLGAGGQKAKVADAPEARGQHVEQEAPDELLGIQGQGFE
jgi:hypothetical protein